MQDLGGATLCAPYARAAPCRLLCGAAPAVV